MTSWSARDRERATTDNRATTGATRRGLDAKANPAAKSRGTAGGLALQNSEEVYSKIRMRITPHSGSCQPEVAMYQGSVSSPSSHSAWVHMSTPGVLSDTTMAELWI